MAISDGESGAQEQVREPVDPIPFDQRFSRGGLWVMRSIPKCLRGAHVGVVRVSMHEVLDGKESGNVEREVRGWKLFFLLPRLLCCSGL